MTTTSLNSMNPLTAEADAAAARAAARRARSPASPLTVAAVQFSIAIGEILLALTALAWIFALVLERRARRAVLDAAADGLRRMDARLGRRYRRIRRPASRTANSSCCCCLVPLTYDLVDEGSAVLLTTIILAAAAVSAVVGIGQYSILHYDNLGQRPRSTLGLYMTFSGLMMLALTLARSRGFCS